MGSSPGNSLLHKLLKRKLRKIETSYHHKFNTQLRLIKLDPASIIVNSQNIPIMKFPCSRMTGYNTLSNCQRSSKIRGQTFSNTRSKFSIVLPD
jgi:hypothetical protein